jgi:hypothetical protein
VAVGPTQQPCVWVSLPCAPDLRHCTPATATCQLKLRTSVIALLIYTMTHPSVLARGEGAVGSTRQCCVWVSLLHASDLRNLGRATATCQLTLAWLINSKTPSLLSLSYAEGGGVSAASHTLWADGVAVGRSQQPCAWVSVWHLCLPGCANAPLLIP